MMKHYQHIANRSLWLNQRVETDLSQYVKMANIFSVDVTLKSDISPTFKINKSLVFLLNIP